MKQKQKKVHLQKLQPNLSKLLAKDLKWFAPYIESVQDLVDFSRVKKISYYMHRSHHKKTHHYAITHKLNNNRTHLIYIRTRLDKNKRIPVDIDMQEDLLLLLAHELAHVCPEGWEHGPKHLKIMSNIFQRFGEVIERIDSEQNRNKK